MLAELCAGNERIGALYCFVHRGKVYFYQSGFRYSSDGKMKPGLLTHYFSIRYCLKRPELNEYDFLAGDSQYKRSLATANRPLQWIVVRRFTVPSLLFGGLRWMKRKYVQIFNKSRRENKPVRGAERSSDISVPDNEIGSMGEAHGKK
jgi:CelD/BcsL family acetyltransferase involved in cellulose biosynthesis